MRLFVIFIFLCVLGAIGCSTTNIARRGVFIDENTIVKGMSRDEVLSILGAPIESNILENNNRKEFFRLEQGDTTGGKVAKGAAATVLAIGTLGISEFVTNPVTKKRGIVSVAVWYDQDEKVIKTHLIKAKKRNL